MNEEAGQARPDRRGLLRRMLLWTLAAGGGLLLYPLTRFTSFVVKPEPRRIVVNKRLQTGDVHTDRDFILFLRQDGPLAVSRRCTHLGCRVGYREEMQLIECPCHQSRFQPDGTRISGPAEKNLPRYPVEILNDNDGTVSGYAVIL